MDDTEETTKKEEEEPISETEESTKEEPIKEEDISIEEEMKIPDEPVNEESTSEPAKEEHTAINKVMLWQIISAILAVLLVISIFTGGFGITGGATTDVKQADAQPADNQPADNKLDMQSLMDDDAVEGSEDAKVTIVEWSDFECPFCVRFYQQTLGKIREQYIDTGKVKLVFRDFPLGFHANAQKAAEAAECAGEQGKFWEMHNMLFVEGVSGGVDTFKQYAADLALDTEKFNECLDTGAMTAEIQKDQRDGAAAGIKGTPGFIINGQLVSGAQPFEVFQQVIETELAK